MAFKTFTIEEATSADINTYLMPQAIITCTAGTRPGSPISGMRIWQTDTLTGYIYVSGSWVLYERAAPLVRKPANEFCFNSTTLQNDDDLFVAVQPNAAYIMELFLIYDTWDQAHLKIGWSGPSGTTMTWVTYGFEDPPHTTSISPIGVGAHSISDTVILYSENATPHPATGMHMRGILLSGSTAGNLQFMWAQDVAQTDNSHVRANSSLRLVRID